MRIGDKASKRLGNAPKGGRPSKYTDETLDDLISALEAGNNLADSCVAAGISTATLEDWRRDKPGFSDLIKQAEKKAKTERLKRINNAGINGHWQADAWYLERRYPDEFARKLVIEIKPEHDAIMKKLGITPAEAWLKLMSNLVAAYEQSINPRTSIEPGGLVIDQQVSAANDRQRG